MSEIDGLTYGLTYFQDQRGGPQWRPFNRRTEVNTDWMRARWGTRRCPHVWRVAHDNGAHACARCGVFRWYPLVALWSRA